MASRIVGLFACVACFGGRASSSVATQAATTQLPTIVVVSFDALGDRFLDRDTLPNFHRLMEDGVRAPFRPQFPSKTFPNHYSMATGLTPGEHEIVVNSFFDPKRGETFLRKSATEGSWFGGEPIWVTAERAGIRTAAYFWTGSEAEIKGVRPTNWKLFDATVPDSVKFGQIMQWLRAPTAERPHLVMMYSGVVDGPSDRYGPESPQSFAAVLSEEHSAHAVVSTGGIPGRVEDESESALWRHLHVG